MEGAKGTEGTRQGCKGTAQEVGYKVCKGYKVFVQKYGTKAKVGHKVGCKGRVP